MKWVNSIVPWTRTDVGSYEIRGHKGSRYVNGSFAVYFNGKLLFDDLPFMRLAKHAAQGHYNETKYGDPRGKRRKVTS